MQEHDHDTGSGGEHAHHAPTAHYYKQVARGKLFGRILFIVIAIVVFIILFILLRGARNRSQVVDPLTASAVMTQGNVKYVELGQQFDLLNSETAFVKDTDASVKILGYAYLPCGNDTQCVQKGIYVNYVLVDKGIQYKNEYGKSVNTNLFPYDVRMLKSDYQTFATFVVYLKGTPPGQTPAPSGGQNPAPTPSPTPGQTPTPTPTPTPAAVTWQKITIAGRDFSYPSDWTAQKLEPSLCQGVILTKKSSLMEKVGEIVMYEDIACNNDAVEDPASYNPPISATPLVRTVRVHGVRVFVTVQKDDATRAQIDSIINKL